MFLYPDNLKDVLQQLYEGKVRSPSISGNPIFFIIWHHGRRSASFYVMINVTAFFILDAKNV